MQRAMMLATGAALLAACASGSSKSRTAAPAVTETGVAVTPAATTAVTPLPTTVEDAVMEQTVRACMTPALPNDAGAAAKQLDTCLNRGEGGFHVVGIEGSLPLILVEVLDQPGLCRAHAFIVWRRSGWHLQNATVLLPDPVDDRLLGRYTLLPGGPVPQSMMAQSTIARLAADGGATLLTVLAGIASCGSGPGAVPMLFALDGDAWRLAWDPRGTDMRMLSDTEAAFAADTGDTVQVHGALWLLEDPVGEIFYESHPGPHRYVDQTWTRDGQRYVLSASQVEPSAYNTLVNFVYRLSTGNEAGAAKLLADASLLDTAKQLGLIQQPLGQRWTTNLDPNTQCCGPIHILSGPEWKTGPPQPVVVTFEQHGADWLISGIAPG